MALFVPARSPARPAGSPTTGPPLTRELFLLVCDRKVAQPGAIPGRRAGAAGHSSRAVTTLMPLRWLRAHGWHSTGYPIRAAASGRSRKAAWRRARRPGRVALFAYRLTAASGLRTPPPTDEETKLPALYLTLLRYFVTASRSSRALTCRASSETCLRSSGSCFTEAWMRCPSSPG